MKLSNKQYDFLKWFALVAIPAAVTLILTVGKIWGLPQYDNIGATVSAFGLFIAALIGASSNSYFGEYQDGNIIYDEAELYEGDGGDEAEDK